jgi:hypothetical protein
MNELAALLSDNTAAAAAVLSDTAARDWLSIPTPPQELSSRVRNSAVCIAIDGDRAFLMPFFLLSDRLALCVRAGSLHAPVSGWWTPFAPNSAISRVVVDVITLAIVEAYHIPNTGVLFRALVCSSNGAGEIGSPSAYATFLAVPMAPAATAVVHQRTVTSAIYRRDIDWPATTLAEASLPPPIDADSVLPPWMHFAERLHLALHGPISISTRTTLPSATEPAAVIIDEQHCTMTVTINDPDANTVLTTQQPPPPPPPLLPRP